MVSFFKKITAILATTFNKGVAKTIKKRLKRARESATEASEAAWANSNANPLAKPDLQSELQHNDLNHIHRNAPRDSRTSSQASSQVSMKATGTRWSLHNQTSGISGINDLNHLKSASDPYRLGLAAMEQEDLERNETIRRAEIVRIQLQRRGQIVRDLHLFKMTTEKSAEEQKVKNTTFASDWIPQELLMGDFCELDENAVQTAQSENIVAIEESCLVTEIDHTAQTNMQESAKEKDDANGMTTDEIEAMAISLLKPPPPTSAQLVAAIAAKTARAVAAKTHAKLQALDLEKLTEETTTTQNSRKAANASRLRMKATEVVPSYLRETAKLKPASYANSGLTSTTGVTVEYKATIQPSAGNQISELSQTAAQNLQSTQSNQSAQNTQPAKTLNDTHEKIEERFAYRTSPEHALKLIAQSIETPTATLNRLASHENPHIRTAVARNPNTSGESLWLLARDYEASIRYSLAESAHTPLDVLRALTKDRNQLVAWVAQNSLNNLKKKLGQNATQLDERTTQSARERIEALLKRGSKHSNGDDIAVLEMTAKSSSTSATKLDELANHDNARVRAAVAENSSTPLHALWTLVRDTDPNVKIKLTYNCNCPIEILEVIKNDKDSFVAQKAKDMLKGLKGPEKNFANGALDAARNQIRTYLTWP